MQPRQQPRERIYETRFMEDLGQLNNKRPLTAAKDDELDPVYNCLSALSADAARRAWIPATALYLFLQMIRAVPVRWWTPRTTYPSRGTTSPLKTDRSNYLRCCEATPKRSMRATLRATPPRVLVPRSRTSALTALTAGEATGTVLTVLCQWSRYQVRPLQTACIECK